MTLILVLLVLILSLLPVLFWLLIYRWQDKKDIEPWFLIRWLLVSGALLALFILFFYDSVISPSKLSYFSYLESFLPIWLATIFLVFLEEGLKLLLLFIICWRRKELNQIIDGVQYGVALSLGFAAVENIIYFLPLVILSSLPEVNNYPLFLYFILVFMGRGLFSTLLHSLTGGIMGLGLGRARFNKSRFYWLDILYVFILAITIHSFFNLFIYLNNITVSIILVSLVTWYFFYNLRSRKNIKIKILSRG